MSQYELYIDYDDYNSATDIYNQTSHADHFLVQNGETMIGNTSLEVQFLEGENHHGNSWLMVDEWDELSNLNQHGQAEALRQSWWIYVPESWTMEAGGRFYAAAYAIGSGASGGGNPDGTNGWSVRGSRQNGPDPWDLSVQIYAVDGPGNHYFQHSDQIYHGWTHFETFVQCNTISGGSGNADGEIRIWVDGDLVHDSDGWLWTHEEDNMIQRCGVGTWTVSSHAPDADYNFYYDGHAVDTSGDTTGEPWGPPDETGDAPPPEPPTGVNHVDEDFEHEDLGANYTGDVDDFDIVGGD